MGKIVFVFVVLTVFWKKIENIDRKKISGFLTV